MPSILTKDTYNTISVEELHPTFAAEVRGVDFQTLSDKQLAEILAALAKYGVCVFRKTGLDDATHVEFFRRLGELDNIKRYMVSGRKPRYGHYELFDAGNIDENGEVLDPNSPRAQFGKGNALFHVDSSFNPRRSSFSCLRAITIPPPDLNLGGDTEFADSRTAYTDLPHALRSQLLKSNYIGAHTIAHSRKLGSPDFFRDLDPTTDGFAYHKILQTHEPSGRKNLYIAAHLHHIESLPEYESQTLIRDLLAHVSSAPYTTSIPWLNESDMIIWDNRCVLHRSGPFKGAGRYKRDLRRTTVHDDGRDAWGENRVDMGFVEPKAKGDAANEAIQERLNAEKIKLGEGKSEGTGVVAREVSAEA